MSIPADRQNYRFAPVNWGHEVNIRVEDRSYKAVVRDESLGGLGLHLPKRCEVERGQLVRIDNGLFARTGEIVFVDSNPDGSLRVGLRWPPDSDYEALDRLEGAASAESV
jgi:hypothetical protein